jgi:hypothetical protein
MTDAHYVDAIRGFSRIKGGEAILAADVDKNMLECAKKHDLAMLILQELRISEITNLIRDSEREGGERGDSDFMVAMKLALYIFASTHVIKYVRLAIELWIWQQTRSEADATLFTNFLFTKKSLHG